MTPGDLTSIEDTLRRAYADASRTVPDNDVGPGVPMGTAQGRPQREAGRLGRRRRWIVPAAAGAAVAAVALVAALILPSAPMQRPPLSLGPLHMGYVVTWAGTVVPVNLATGTVQPAIKTGAPGGLAGAVISPDGRTVYAATNRGYVVPVDAVTRTAGHPIRIGGVAAGMLISPDGSIGYVPEPPYGVAVVDLALNKPAGFIKVRDALQFALTPDGKTLYVLSESFVSTPNPSRPVAVTPIDTATLKQLPPVHLPYRVGMPADDIVAAPDGKTVYVLANEQAANPSDARGVLTPISTATNTALAPIQLPAGLSGGPLSVSPDNRTAFVGLTGSNEVAAVDLDTGAVRWTASVAARGAPDAEDISPDGKTLYAAVGEEGSDDVVLYKISSATGVTQNKGTIRGAPGPRWVNFSLTFDPDGKTVYIQSAAPPDGMNEPNPAALLPVDLATGHAGLFIHIPDRGELLFGPS